MDPGNLSLADFFGISIKPAVVVLHTEAKQGHPYQFHDRKCIALTGGTSPRVLFVDPTDPPWIWDTQRIHVTNLKPLPLRYFNGELT